MAFGQNGGNWNLYAVDGTSGSTLFSDDWLPNIVHFTEVADLNGDNRADVAIGDANGNVYIYSGASSGATSPVKTHNAGGVINGLVAPTRVEGWTTELGAFYSSSSGEVGCVPYSGTVYTYTLPDSLEGRGAALTNGNGDGVFGGMAIYENGRLWWNEDGYTSMTNWGDAGEGIYRGSLGSGYFDSGNTLDFHIWAFSPQETRVWNSAGTQLWLQSSMGWLSGSGGNFWDQIRAGDLDNDGKDEIVVSRDNGNWARIWVLEGDTGNAVWSSSQYTAPETVNCIAVGEVTGDAYEDVIIGTDSRVRVLNGNDGSFEADYSTGAVVRSVEVGNFYGDASKNEIVYRTTTGVVGMLDLCDTTAPTITVNTAGGNTYATAPTMDVDFSDAVSLDDAYYKVDSSSPTGTDTTGWTAVFTSHSGTSYTSDFQMSGSVWSGLSEGAHTVYFKCWDDAGNVNDGATPAWTFTKDATAPTITVNTAGGNHYASAPTLDVDFSDAVSLDDAYYQVDSYSPTGTGTTGWTAIFTDHAGSSYTTDFALDGGIWSGLSEGAHTVYFKCWDDAGNVNDGTTPSLTFTKDITAPTITVNTAGGNHYATAPTLDVDFGDSYSLDDAYYKVDSSSPTGTDTTGWTSVFTSYSGTSYTTDFALDGGIWAGLSDGSHTVYFKCWDDAGNVNDGTTPSLTFTKDITAPTITVNTAGGNHYATAPTLDVDFSDAVSLDDAYYQVDGYSPTGTGTTGWTVIFTDHAGTTYATDFALDNGIWAALDEGEHTVYFKAWDDLGNVNDGASPAWTFTKDTVAPTITVNTAGGNYYAAAPTLDMDFSDAQALDDGYYKVDSSSPTGTDTTGWTPIFTNYAGTSYTTDFALDNGIWAGLSEGSHTVYFKAWDDAGNINDGATPAWTFIKDATAPTITVNTAGGNSYATAPMLDVDFSDAVSLDEAYYQVDGYSPTGTGTTGWMAIFTDHAGTTYTTDFTLDGGIWAALGEGSHTVYFKCWDDAGNVNDGATPSLTFTKETGKPTITINSPSGIHYSTVPSISLGIDDPSGLDDAYYQVDSYSPTGTSTTGWTALFTDHAGTAWSDVVVLDGGIWAALGEGEHAVYFKAWDDLANVNDGATPAWTFTKDETAPTITVNTADGNHYATAPTLDVDFGDSYSLDDAYYQVDGYSPAGTSTTGWMAIFTNLGGTTYTTDFALDGGIWAGLSAGSHTVYFKCWDDAGNVNDGTTPSLTFTKDAAAPTITVNMAGGNYYATAPTLDVDFDDVNSLDDAYYQVDSYSPSGTSTTGWTAVFTDHAGTAYTTDFAFDGGIWGALGEGEHTVYFKCWDDAGNVNDGATPAWQFHKHTGAPAITVHSANDTFHETAPTLDVDFVDPSGLHSAYYQVDAWTPTGTGTAGWTAIFTDHAGTTYTTDFTLDGGIWAGLAAGWHVVHFKAWNDFTQVNDGEVPCLRVYKSGGPTTVTVNTANGTIHAAAPTLDVDFASPDGLASAYYQVDAWTPTGTETTGWTAIFIDHPGTASTANFTLEATLWAGLADGDHHIYFKVVNDFGAVVDGPVPALRVTRDTTAPHVDAVTSDGTTICETASQTVHASFHDPTSGVAWARVYYRTDVQDWSASRHASLVSGTGVIPNTAYAAGRVVFYYVAVADNAGHVAFRGATGQVATEAEARAQAFSFVVVVDEALPPTIGPVTFEPAIPENVNQTVHCVVTDAGGSTLVWARVYYRHFTQTWSETRYLPFTGNYSTIPATTYRSGDQIFFYVAARDGAGNVAFRALGGNVSSELAARQAPFHFDVTGMMVPPGAPTLGAIVPAVSTTGNVTLSWNAVSLATQYRVYRHGTPITSLNASVTPLATLPGTAYLDAGLANGTYYYAVTALNVAGESAPSACQRVSVRRQVTPATVVRFNQHYSLDTGFNNISVFDAAGRLRLQIVVTMNSPSTLHVVEYDPAHFPVLGLGDVGRGFFIKVGDAEEISATNRLLHVRFYYALSEYPAGTNASQIRVGKTNSTHQWDVVPETGWHLAVPYQVNPVAAYIETYLGTSDNFACVVAVDPDTIGDPLVTGLDVDGPPALLVVPLVAVGVGLVGWRVRRRRRSP